MDEFETAVGRGGLEPRTYALAGAEPHGCHGAHARIRTGDLFLTKEVLDDNFSFGAPLRSNAEAIAISRCLAALPIFKLRPVRIFSDVHALEPVADRGRRLGVPLLLVPLRRPLQRRLGLLDP